jgi:hypothetical protein
MKHVVFWVMKTPCGSSLEPTFGGKYPLQLRGNERHDYGDTGARGFLPRTSWVTSSLQTSRNQSPFTLKMEAICSSETSVLTENHMASHTAEDSILHCLWIVCRERNSKLVWTGNCLERSGRSRIWRQYHDLYWLQRILQMSCWYSNRNGFRFSFLCLWRMPCSGI